MKQADLDAMFEHLAPIVREFANGVAQRMADVDAKERGLDGQDGAQGPEGQQGRDGRDGLPGVPGLDGEKGSDGKDGLGIDDIQVEHDGERSFSFKFVRGDKVKQFGAFTVPLMIYRGVFDERQSYGKDDVTTWAGAMWIAKVDRPTGKPNASPEWQLVVKKGSDGKQGPEGKSGPMGSQGPKGPIGAKW